MAKIVESSEVEQVVRKYLKDNGCVISPSRKHGETGADIIATKGVSTWMVEVIGFQGVPSMRSREFYEVFFRIISRDRDNPNDILVVALPKRFKIGMRQRTRQYPIAWRKLGKAFPKLNIWYVDTAQGNVEEYAWSSPHD